MKYELALYSQNFHITPTGEFKASTDLTYSSPFTQRIFSDTKESNPRLDRNNIGDHDNMTTDATNFDRMIFDIVL
ncbi:hypothetical protein TNCV_4823191 [Trichonephila clavipes]|nr:hypothetical protein TNCV_4823191 [Trichonephila clavipes]